MTDIINIFLYRYTDIIVLLTRHENNSVQYEKDYSNKEGDSHDGT